MTNVTATAMSDRAEIASMAQHPMKRYMKMVSIITIPPRSCRSTHTRAGVGTGWHRRQSFESFESGESGESGEIGELAVLAVFVCVKRRKDDSRDNSDADKSQRGRYVVIINGCSDPVSSYH